jgi:selenocysteine lyase/cysteine desulfurase
VDWDALRKREFPVTERWAYFDHAAVAPLPKRSGDMLRAWAAEQESNGVVNWLDWERKLEATRGRCAALIGSDPEEIAFVNSTTHGIGIVAEGFPWHDGDNVVTAAEEYPSNVYPWMNLASRGVSLRLVPSRDGRVPIEDLIAAIDARTRLLTISHVEWSTGYRNDLDALGAVCHDRGIALFVDAIQGLGPLTIDVARTPIDFLCADGHKWLLGPEGAGLLYIRREWIERLRPIGVGWHSVVSSFNTPGFDFTLKPNAQRWEGGSFNMPGLQCFGASLELLAEIGREAVSERILDRAVRVREIARQCDWSVVGSQAPADLSGIVALEKPGIDPNRFALEARTRQVAIASRLGKIRVSPHIYNNDDDLERLAETLRGREGVSR